MHKLKLRILELFRGFQHTKSPEAEADRILLHVFQKQDPTLLNPSDLILRSPVPTEETGKEALRIAEERAKGIPLQHLLGKQFFYEHEYSVNDSTLIPRPETEILCESILNWIRSTHPDGNVKFAELGVGTGILSGEILAHFKKAHGIGSEVSANAIALAVENIGRVAGPGYSSRYSILEPMDPSVGFEIFQDNSPFDLILSNPPYVSVRDQIEKEVLDHEPHLALFPKTEGANENPNHFYESFLYHAKTLLKARGSAFFEIPHERADTLKHEFENAGFAQVTLIPDLTGRSRVLQASQLKR